MSFDLSSEVPSCHGKTTSFAQALRRWARWGKLALVAATLLGGLPAGLRAADKLQPRPSELSSMAREARQALSYLADYHYSQKKVDALPPERIIREYIEDLDYGRMFFTEKDIQDFIKEFEATLQNVYLSRGDLYPAFEIYNRYYRLAQKRLKWVETRLKKDFKFDSNERYIPDRTKADYPKDNRAADALWDARLTNELLGELLNGCNLNEAKAKLAKRYARTERLLDELDAKDVQATFLTSVAKMFDPHSNFFSTDDLEDFSISMSNVLVGIGAMLRDEDGYCVVQELIPGGPAETAGTLHPGDKIVEVAQEDGEPVDVVDLKISKIVKMIRGEPGTNVILTIVPADATDDAVRKTIKLERNEVRLTENLASARIIEIPTENDKKTTPIGVIELPSFYGGSAGETSTTSADIRELIQKLQGMGVEGLVLDLRRNGGGLLSEAINVVGLFLPNAPAVQVRDSSGRVRVDRSRPGKALYDGPLVVLTSRMSASASEIVAGALQCLNRALVIGDHATHGKGTVQAIFEIDRGLLAQFMNQVPSGAIKVTVQKFYLPNGASTQNKGVLSDIALPSVNDVLPIGESDLTHALPWDTIAPADWTRADSGAGIDYLNENAHDYLAKLSLKRRQELPEFAYLSEIVWRLKTKQEEKAVSLNYDTRLKEKQLNEAFSVESERKRRELNRERYPSADVLLDISWKMKAEHQQQLQNTPLADGTPRANAVYENIFYYAPEGATEIKEIRADKIDYQSLGAYMDVFGEKLHLNAEELRALLEHFQQGEYRAEFNIRENFQKALGGSVPAERLKELPREFFETLLELQPDLAEEHPNFDIPLREALRVAADWAAVKKSELLTRAGEEATASSLGMRADVVAGK